MKGSKFTSKAAEKYAEIVIKAQDSKQGASPDMPYTMKISNEK